MAKQIIQIVYVHPDAPNKPALNQACNGCGLCCAAEPCPVAMFWLWQFKGACRALLWQENRYVCGLVREPQNYIVWLPQRWRAWFGKRVLRRISSGVGCDFIGDVTGGE